MKFKLGDTDIPFVFRGDELMYPNYVKDGLVLHYDFSGMTNADTSRGIATDLSGNGNHGTLQNFNFTPESGYDKNKLSFDGVDDFIDASIEELNLDPDNMTAQIDNMIYSYKDGQVMYTKSNDASAELEGIEVGGRNLVVYSGITNGFVITSSGTVGYSSTHKITDFIPIKANTEYIFSAEQMPETDRAYENMRVGFYDIERNFLNAISVVEPKKKGEVFTTPENAHFTRISIGNYPINLMLIKGNVSMDYQPAPEDTEAKITTIQEQKIQSYKLYNRALTEEEIAHNYAIEKERFGIE